MVVVAVIVGNGGGDRVGVSRDAGWAGEVGAWGMGGQGEEMGLNSLQEMLARFVRSSLNKRKNGFQRIEFKKMVLGRPRP